MNVDQSSSPRYWSMLKTGPALLLHSQFPVSECPPRSQILTEWCSTTTGGEENVLQCESEPQQLEIQQGERCQSNKENSWEGKPALTDNKVHNIMTLAPVKMAEEVQLDSNLQIPGGSLSIPSSPATARNDCSITPLTPSPSPRVEVRPRMACPFSVVIAIDFGTTSSGYAFSFTQDSEAIHMMKRWEGGDPGVANQKSPTCLLLTPDLRFHSFGFAARDFYHDLDPEEAQHWLYFDKFKMKIHSTSAQVDHLVQPEFPTVDGGGLGLQGDKELLRAVGRHQSSLEDAEETYRRGSALYFLCLYAGLPYCSLLMTSSPAGSTHAPTGLKPGASAKHVRRLSHELLGRLPPHSWDGDHPSDILSFQHRRRLVLHLLKQNLQSPLLPRSGNTATDCATTKSVFSEEAQGMCKHLDGPDLPTVNSLQLRLHPREQLRRSRHSRTFLVESGTGELWSELQTGDRYVVADCGGGTVDLTVHQIEQPQGTLKELYKASGGPYGAVGVDLAFEAMLCQIFGEDFIQSFKAKRPAAWVDLMIAFEARKRTASPGRANALNISLPFSFIDFYKRHRGQSVEAALRRSNMNIVKWSSQGMLRLTQEAMNELFQPTISNIVRHIEELMGKPEVRCIRFLFLVGGFAESSMLQKAVQKALGRTCRIIIPHDVGLTILKGAVLFGLDPTVVRVRRCPVTYGVGVLNRFVEGRHPRDKLLIKDGREWCTDIFDRFVSIDQSVALGEVVRRSYTPARVGQRKIIINIYCSATDDVTYISDPGVRKCGTITLDLPEPLVPPGAVGGPEAGAVIESPERREIRATMQFGDTEIKVTAIDVMSNRSVRASIDFLSN
ncbi:hypothetical protein CCH79_00011613 [Gambusia affinis]|uniref:Heat shock protein 12B n=1 Tax=Gambusia affinis TaxID=33528 RepID=A0A315VU93_GAMAF|nr:hypothetical protein CCH79_00011613 [Gambusia affinis]